MDISHCKEGYGKCPQLCDVGEGMASLREFTFNVLLFPSPVDIKLSRDNVNNIQTALYLIRPLSNFNHFQICQINVRLPLICTRLRFWQSYEMSRIFRINPCKNIGRLEKKFGRTRNLTKASPFRCTSISCFQAVGKQVTATALKR